MEQPHAKFTGLVEEILRRFCGQNGWALPAAERLSSYGERLWGLLAERGLPRPLVADELGAPGELAEETCAPLVARVLGDTAGEERDFFAIPVRQLVKACFHEEFKVCRDSFRAASPDGICRRQQVDRARLRVSGTHCIDCPYWVSLSSENHREFLAKEWQLGGRETLKSHEGIFLPEDFRRLRRYLHHAARTRI